MITIIKGIIHRSTQSASLKLALTVFEFWLIKIDVGELHPR